jgi:hypothetical protein
MLIRTQNVVLFSAKFTYPKICIRYHETPQGMMIIFSVAKVGNMSRTIRGQRLPIPSWLRERLQNAIAALQYEDSLLPAHIF